MRRTFLAVILLTTAAACRRESQAPHSAAIPAARPPAPPVKMTTAPPPPAHPVSTPERCAGDGSYAQAVDCFRIARAHHFVWNDGEGDLDRGVPGRERVTLRVKGGADRGSWVAEVKPAGVAWMHDGARAPMPPAGLERIFQRVTLFPDPQKKEGTARVAGTADGQTRYEFTDVNSGDRYEVIVSQADGRIVRLKVNQLTMSFS